MIFGFRLILIFFYFFIANAFAVSIEGISITQQLNFGRISTSSNDGLVSSNGTATNNIQVISNNSNANLVVDVASTDSNGNQIKLFIQGSAQLSLGGNNIDTSLSFDSQSITTSLIKDFTGKSAIFNIPIYGVASILANQSPGTYNGNYDITICSCDNGVCPAEISDCIP